MFYVDSNVFIYPIIYDEATVPEARKSRRFLLEIALGRIEAYTSTLTWDEVTWIVRRLLGVDISLRLGRRFLSFPSLKFLAVKGTTLLKAQEIMEEYELNLEMLFTLRLPSKIR